MSIERDLERGAHADRLLKDVMLSEAFDNVRKAIHERWEHAPLSDREGQHELLLMLRLLNDVRSNLEQAVADGNFAADKLKHLQRNQTPAEWRASNYR